MMDGGVNTDAPAAREDVGTDAHPEQQDANIQAVSPVKEAETQADWLPSRAPSTTDSEAEPALHQPRPISTLHTPVEVQSQVSSLPPPSEHTDSSDPLSTLVSDGEVVTDLYRFVFLCYSALLTTLIAATVKEKHCPRTWVNP